MGKIMNGYVEARAKMADALALLDSLEEHLVAAHLSMALELLDQQMPADAQSAL